VPLGIVARIWSAIAIDFGRYRDYQHPSIACFNAHQSGPGYGTNTLSRSVPLRLLQRADTGDWTSGDPQPLRESAERLGWKICALRRLLPGVEDHSRGVKTSAIINVGTRARGFIGEGGLVSRS